MGRKRAYDEVRLGPLEVTADVWYRLPSDDRRAIFQVAGSMIGERVGYIQDALLANDQPRLADRFMRTMMEHVELLEAPPAGAWLPERDALLANEEVQRIFAAGESGPIRIEGRSTRVLLDDFSEVPAPQEGDDAPDLMRALKESLSGAPKVESGDDDPQA